MLESRTIVLRALEPGDVDILYKWENDAEIWHLSNTLTPYSRFVLEQYIMNSHEDIYTTKQLRLMIDLILGDKKETIGAIDLFDFDPANRRAGVGILIRKDKRGKGYASEALEILIKYAFKKLNLHQLYSNVLVDQEANLELFRKKNFEIIGIKKEWVLIDNKWMDEYILQLINEEN